MSALLPPALLQGRDACTELLRQMLCSLGAAQPDPACGPPPTDALMVDDWFAGWPLDEPAVLQSLSTWLRPSGRCLRIVGLDFEALARSQPKFARWRRDWTHRIEVWRPADGQLAPGLRLLRVGKVVAQRLDAPDWRLQRFTDSVHVGAMHEQCADFLQRCEPAWPVTTLGL